jgi:hypothetical protein
LIQETGVFLVLDFFFDRGHNFFYIDIIVSGNEGVFRGVFVIGVRHVSLLLIFKSKE